MLHLLLHLLPFFALAFGVVTYNDIPPGPAAVVALGTAQRRVPGDRYQKRVRVTGDAAYPTGGYAAPTPQQLGFSVQIDGANIEQQHPGGTDSFWLFNTVTQKLQLIVSGTGNELGNGQDAHLAFCDVTFIGY